MSSLDITQRVMQAIDRPASIEHAARITEDENATKDAPWRVLLTKGHINAARLRKVAPWCVMTGSMLTVAGLLILTHGPINLLVETSRAVTGTVKGAWSFATSANQKAVDQMAGLGLLQPNTTRPAVRPAPVPTPQQQDEFGARADAIRAAFKAMPAPDVAPGAGITGEELLRINSGLRGWLDSGLPSGTPLTEVDQAKFWGGDPPKNSGAWMTKAGSDLATVRALVAPRPGAPSVRWMMVCRKFQQGWNCKEIVMWETKPLLGVMTGQPLDPSQIFITMEALGVLKIPGYSLKKGS